MHKLVLIVLRRSTHAAQKQNVGHWSLSKLMRIIKTIAGFNQGWHRITISSQLINLKQDANSFASVALHLVILCK
jgi:hypothetical protein